MKDITIVGAGLVGKSLAVALAPLDLSITILENQPKNIKGDINQDRPLSLTHASVEILKALEIWPSLQNTAVPIKSVHVSEQSRFGTLCFSAEEMRVPALGYVVSYANLQDALYEAIIASENISIREIKSVEAISQYAEYVSVNFTENGPQEISSKLLIATDGEKSHSRDLLNIPVKKHPSDDVAMIGSLIIDGVHNNRAYERFTKEGTMALLPLANKNEYRFVWTLPKKIADNFTEKSIQEQFNQSFANRIAIKQLTKTAQFPLETIIAEQTVKNRAALLGNAAHAIYPLAAQGFNLSLREVADLAELIADAVLSEQSLSSEILLKYATNTAPNQKRIIDITRQISVLFDLPLIGSLRGMGLLATSLIKPAKFQLARRLMGLAGKVPKLARGVSIHE